MDVSNWRGLTLALGLALPAMGCTSGGGGDGGGGLTIVSCSLGCSSSNGTGGQFSCGITDVYLNQEIRVTFSQPLDLSSVSNNSFRMVEIRTGKTPPGTFRLDGVDPNVLIYRPQLTFDSTGNPIFGLTRDETYRLTIPGTAQGDLGPFIRSKTGEVLQTRLLCTLLASRGVFDAKPGRPRHTMTVTRVQTYDANNKPETFKEVAAAGANQVHRTSEIKLVFDDVMNPGTLVNPVQGTSNTITVKVDPDGDPNDPADQIAIDGEFSITLDQVNLKTTVLFRPTVGYPSSGSDLAKPRRIVVELSSTIADLGDNVLVTPGTTVFTPERIDFPIVEVDEQFLNTAFEDAVHGGSPWGNGQLTGGLGGGSGALGDLVIPAGETIVLRTDSEDFSAAIFSDPAVFNVGNVLDPPVPFQVDGGIFEFARLLIEAGGRLRFEGPNPARLYVRGECIVQGTIDVSGAAGLAHDATSFAGGIAGSPGPGGGRGGDGGARPDGENWSPLLDNVSDPGPVDPTDPAQYALVNGQDGVGIPFPDATSPVLVAAGFGGLAWPQPGALAAPNDLIHFPADRDDSLTSFPYSREVLCSINAPGGPGSGGAYARSGFGGSSYFIGVTIPPRVPIEAGGDSALLALDDVARRLSPDSGHLRGGSGGGGGGAHLLQTRVNGLLLNDCTKTGSGPLEVVEFVPYSGASGGSAGGALQAQAGRRLVLNGEINASGGDGGSTQANSLASPGGGGSGGAVLLQSPSVVVQSVPNRINVAGGIGGIGFNTNTAANGRALGGRAGPGLVRIEKQAPALVPEIEGTKVTPNEAALVSTYGPGASIRDVLSTGVWTGVGEGPSGLSGAQSCWFSERDLVDPDNPLEPIQNFFKLEFEEDGVDELGWDMSVQLQGFADLQSYRGENDLTGPGGQSLQDLFGSDLGAAPVLVRFQGAKAIGTLSQPCNVKLTGLESPIIPGSLTGWVRHPRLLQTFHADPGLAPNIFRFMVIWDSNDPNYATLQAIDRIQIRVRPD